MSTATANRAQQQTTQYAPVVAPPERRPRRSRFGSAREGSLVVRWVVEILIAIASALFLLPVVLIFLTALKPEGEIIHFDSLLPRHPVVGARENFGHLHQNTE